MRLRWLLLPLLAAMLLGALAGPAGFDPRDPNVVKLIIGYRLPRTVLAMLVGASLASAGCAMQAFFRNPLADPYVLGVSSGASVGAALAVILGVASTQNLMLFAFIAAITTAFAVYRIGGAADYAILLAGIAIASFLSGITALLIYFAQQDMHEIVFWIMGSFSRATWEKVVFLFPVALFTAVYLLLNSWNLNAILLGDEHAMAVGLNVEKFRRVLIAVVSLQTSASVAVSGVIGFVGIIVPHAMRLLFGEGHQRLMPAAIIFGATFMPLVDVVTRITSTGELPVGAITAILGAPFFIYVLRRGL